MGKRWGRRGRAEGDAKGDVPTDAVSDAAEPGAATGPRGGRPRRAAGALWRRRRGIGLALVAVGLFAAGVRAGWELRDREAEVTVLNTVQVDRPVTAIAAADAAIAVPNVIGLGPEDAQRVLTDAGVAAADIDVVEVPAAGEAGLVVRQVPPPGVPVDGTVTLSVSTPGTVPDLVGMTSAEARRALAALGARAVLRAVYAEGALEGTVTETEPASGATLPVEVRVVVAGSPSSVFLADLRPVNRGCADGDVAISGEEFPRSMRCTVLSRLGEGSDFSYLLNRRVNRFEATLGQGDTETPGSVVRVVISADDRVVVDETVAYGEAKAVSVDVSGALRLTISTFLITEGDRTPYVVLGSARVVGGPDAIEELIKSD